jgi:hypothetical protein
MLVTRGQSSLTKETEYNPLAEFQTTIDNPGWKAD